MEKRSVQVVIFFRVDPKTIKNCSVLKETQIITINESGFTPEKITAKVCDQIIFANVGKRYHEPAFGPHPNHLLYPGFKENLLAPKDKESFILKAAGNYELHDHLNENLEAELVVNNF